MPTPPKFHHVPEYVETLGPEYGAIATLAGFAPDPEQQWLLDGANGIDRCGKSTAFEVVVIAPRQNLKTGYFKQQALGDLFIRQEKLVVFSAHEFNTAHEALKDLTELIDGSDYLRRRVKLTRKQEVASHGAVPQIELLPRYGSARLIFKTRSKGGARGLAGRKTFIDEALFAKPKMIGALVPIMLAQPDPQIRFGSSAGLPDSEVLNDLVERGRAGNDDRMMYAEWCTDSPEECCDLGVACTHMRGTVGCGCDKPDVIRAAHSAIGNGRILMQTIIDVRRSMPESEYAREIMGWHDEIVVTTTPALIERERWDELEDRDADNTPEHMPAFSIEMDLDHSTVTIGAAGYRDDERIHVEFVKEDRGTRWLAKFCKALVVENPGAFFAIDGGGPAGHLIPMLEDEGLEIITLAAKDVAEAWAEMLDDIVEGVIVHGPQAELAAAVEGAKPRPLGDGGIAAGRRKSDVNIAPLNTCCFSRWALKRNDGPSLW